LYFQIFLWAISNFQITLWLWFTVLFANFAEAVAEGRGKAQADSLRKSRIQTKARRLSNKKEEVVLATALKKGDIVISADRYPPTGMDRGSASVDESAITGNRPRSSAKAVGTAVRDRGTNQ
jgi:K+-transporting ATPase ATPase B chain